MTKKCIVEQLSIFVHNEEGCLAETAEIIKDCGINVKSFNIAESIGFGMLRAIVDNPDDALKKLTEKGVIVKKTEMLALEARNEVGYLYKIAKAVADARINIEYAYTIKAANEYAILIRVDDIDKTIKLFEKLDIKMLETKDL